MAYPNEDTVRGLRAALRRHGTLRATVTELELPRNYSPTISSVLSNKKNSVSLARENDIRHRLNLFPLGITRLDQIPTKKLADLIRWRREI